MMKSIYKILFTIFNYVLISLCFGTVYATHVESEMSVVTRNTSSRIASK